MRTILVARFMKVLTLIFTALTLFFLASCSPDDDFNLGFNLGYEAYGRGDFVVAFDIWLPLAQEGNAGAQTNLGVMYQLGQGVSQNYAEAFRLFTLAAVQGHTTAQNNLGIMYQNGQGVSQNSTEALRWYRLAAEQGGADAQTNLGVIFATGLGVPQNNVRAYVWFSVSAAQGGEIARDNLDIVRDRLTPAQLAQAQELATRCFESDFQDCE